MGMLQALWLAWCILWALFWATLGWIIFPVGNILMFFLSIVLMIPSFIGGGNAQKVRRH